MFKNDLGYYHFDKVDLEYFTEIKLVGVLGFERGCFLTDDCIEIDEEDFDTVKNILYDVEFEVI